LPNHQKTCKTNVKRPRNEQRIKIRLKEKRIKREKKNVTTIKLAR